MKNTGNVVREPLGAGYLLVLLLGVLPIPDTGIKDLIPQASHTAHESKLGSGR